LRKSQSPSRRRRRRREKRRKVKEKWTSKTTKEPLS